MVTRAQLITGRPDMPPPPTVLRAGPLSFVLDGVDIRHVSLAGTELVQRVYMAVRDAPWNTIPALISDLVVEPGRDRSRVRFHAHHRHEAIDSGVGRHHHRIARWGHPLPDGRHLPRHLCL